MGAFKIDKTVSRKVRTLPELMALDMDDMKTIEGWIDTRFRKNESRQFATEGASGGRKWPKLSARYKKAKQAKRKRVGRATRGNVVLRKKLMQLTGELRAGLVKRGHADHVRFSFLQPRPTVVVGTKNIKAKWHGPIDKRGKPGVVPVRDVLQFTNEQYKGFMMLAADYITSKKLPRVRRALTAKTRLKSTGGRG